MNNGYAQRLGRLLEPRGYRIINVSKPGDTTTKVLDRLEKDLFPKNPDFVIIGLSLENEGIRSIFGKEPDDVYACFKENLKEIIDRCREKNIIPVVGSCYASDNFTSLQDYDYIKRMNLEISEWDVPGINFLGPLDNGSGRFVPGVTFDLDHPDSYGHAELYYAIVPSLFAAIQEGKPCLLLRKQSQLDSE